MISRDLGGAPANGASAEPRISADWTMVAFSSYADDLVFKDTNGSHDVFVVEVGTATVQLVSFDASGQQQLALYSALAISRDGQLVSFTTATTMTEHVNAHQDVYLRDVQAKKTLCISQPDGTTGVGNSDSSGAALALGGSLVAFASSASNLVPVDVNGVADVFVREMLPDPFGYCASSTTSQGCQPQLDTDGYPSVSSGLPFTIVGDDLPNQKTGILFYGFEGASSTPWGGATMCVSGSKKRTPLQSTLGTPPGTDDCTGFLAFDMNAYAAGALGGSPKAELSSVGQQVNVQFWGRDPALPSGTFLSTALQYVVGP
jgi:hypothetical protein